jgi:BarA-like signal transduction histidine kinase
LDKVKQALVSKRWGKLSQGVFFLQDDASSHAAAITQQKLDDLHFEVLKQPAYLSDLGPSHYHLFPNLKKHLKGMKFSTIEDAMSAADNWFAAQPLAFYVDGLKKLEQRSKKCVELGGVC